MDAMNKKYRQSVALLPLIVLLMIGVATVAVAQDGGGQSGAELLIPSVADDLITSGKATIKVLRTDDSWFGVTYRQDKSIAIRCIRKLIDEGVYPEKLWG